MFLEKGKALFVVVHCSRLVTKLIVNPVIHKISLFVTDFYNYSMKNIFKVKRNY